MNNKTAVEKFMSTLLQAGKKYRILKYPVLLCVLVILLIRHAAVSASENGKKCASAAVVFLFCVMSSSFSFPSLTGEAAVQAAETREEQGAETDEEGERVVLLDDSDVLDGYVEAELCNIEDIDKYTLDEILEDNREFPSEAGAPAQAGENAAFNKDDWRLLLINKQHPVPEDYTFTLGTIKGQMKCDVRILDDLLAMLKAAKNDNINLVVCSPYRDINRQEVLFNRKVKAYMGMGMSYMDAYKTSSQAVTVPGASEHQIGLALDIVCDNYTYLDEGFGETPAGQWLAAHSCEYGFILRYPKGKEYITSIEYEPWHFRYVGKEAAKVIMGEKITLEEFVERL